MHFILWLIIGGILGWIASLLMHTDAQQGSFLNVVGGMIGAMVAGLLLTPCLALTPSTSTTSVCQRSWSPCSVRSFCWLS
jgi:uncharacterized membrane protein YeaQ/YmgE (transglycosylase-associated protein family)